VRLRTFSFTARKLQDNTHTSEHSKSIFDVNKTEKQDGEQCLRDLLAGNS
jgi:hypothetical protein